MQLEHLRPEIPRGVLFVCLFPILVFLFCPAECKAALGDWRWRATEGRFRAGCSCFLK